MTENQHNLSRAIERQIARALFSQLTAHGFSFTVAEHEVGQRKSTVLGMLGEVFNSDYITLTVIVWLGASQRGWIKLVLGNGVDLISDYTVGLESFMARANEVARKIEDGQFELRIKP